MVADPGLGKQTRVERIAPLPESEEAVRFTLPPTPPAPDIPRGQPRFAHAFLVGSLFVLAGLAHLTGAPIFISAALGIIGLSGFVMVARTLNAQARAAKLFEATTAQSRNEFESLADRLWELQESEERFHGLIDALGDLVVHRDREGRIVYANRIFAEVVGLEKKRLFGRTLTDVGVDIGIVPDAAFSEGECLSSTDVEIRTSQGPRWFSWIELSVRDKTSDAVSHRAIARDITARKRAETALIHARERAEHASQAKSRFLATVSHEIRTPMNGIMGMAKLLGDTRLSQEQQTYVGAVSTSASALLALIEDLLDYTKIESGRIDIEAQPVSPRELAENVVELLAQRAFAKHIGIGCHVAPDVPVTIEADPGRLRQVLINLVGNAVKFTESGGVGLVVEKSGTDNHPMIRFCVNDTGPGIDAADLARIFQEFEQADDTPTRRHGGAGLGLAISKKIVDRLGGAITVESTPGKGSSFVLEIPAVDALAETSEPANALAGREILIVSQNQVEAETIAATVRAYGGAAIVLATPAQAARHREHCDTLLIDAALEKPDGRLLKRLHTAGLRESIAITLIAPTERALLGQLRANGYASYLARPVRGQTLVRMLLTAAKMAEPAEPTERPKARRSVGVNRGRQRRLSILIAEDNDINALLTQATLSKAGHRVEVVGNGRAAVDLLTRASGHRYDLVLMDLHMPVLDGLDAISAVRRFEQEMSYAPVPIMVLSADSQERTRHSVLAHGASGFVTKPLDPDALVRAVAEQVSS
ncbi:response regulator [Mesorhizobium sp. NBSH29]|uniref:PAS domain-containing hybrid sensor histidine kinase/response regulator n=1 Tax=Mesorhizobium sp. NBSH29 TaxID=2654249 RepID=UPI0018966429|nr:PAS domain-containing hybrid sensor histidine kinase/response regulator [Mesorhizobium sp. NBSH29]QPC86209.1 response regulator [Mesorhizobium sp. NBSH29]